MCMGYAKDIKTWACMQEIGRRDAALQEWGELLRQSGADGVVPLRDAEAMMTSTSTLKPQSAMALARWALLLSVLMPAWWWAYVHLTDLADAIISALGLTRKTALGEAVQFFATTPPRCSCCSRVWCS